MINTMLGFVNAIITVADNGIDLINKVDSFYNSAWSKLLIFGSVSFAIVGIILPIAMQLYQNKILKNSELVLKSEIEKQVLKIKEEILEEINKTLNEKTENFEKKFEILKASADAKAHHIQGSLWLTKGMYKESLSDFLTAANYYIESKDYLNLSSVLQNISDVCLSKLTLEEIEDTFVECGITIDELTEKLITINDNGIFEVKIKELRLKMNQLKRVNVLVPDPH